jgi:hypothetical protein
VPARPLGKKRLKIKRIVLALWSTATICVFCGPIFLAVRDAAGLAA